MDVNLKSSMLTIKPKSMNWTSAIQKFENESERTQQLFLKTATYQLYFVQGLSTLNQSSE